MSRQPAPLVGDAELAETLRQLLGGLERANRLVSRVSLLQMDAAAAGRLWPHRDDVDAAVRAVVESQEEMDAVGEDARRALDMALLRHGRRRRGE